MGRHSAGLDIAWQIAASEASDGQHEFIEPEHLFIGICKLAQAADSRRAKTKDSRAKDESVVAEARAISEIFAHFQLDRLFTYREVRRQRGNGRFMHSKQATVSRSPVSKECFARAQRLTSAQRVLTTLHLFAAFLEQPGHIVTTVLRNQGIDLEAMRLFVRRRAGEETEPAQTAEPPKTAGKGDDIEVAAVIDAKATRPFAAHPGGGASDLVSRLNLLYAMPLKFAQQSRLDLLLQMIVEEMVRSIPGATRGAVLLKDRVTSKMLLKACVADDEPVVSKTLTRRALEEGRGFIWERGEATTVPQSMQSREIQTGMYAPLIWQQKGLGVLCVDNPHRSSVFKDEDLQLLVAVAHYAAMAVANYYSDDDLRKHADFTNRLICSRFPPQLRTKLMQLASTGGLPIGTRQSLVTILISDIRGFTLLSAQIGPQRMADLLNEYFPPLIEAIFSFNGAVNRFAGDAILAVFGSPEPDEKQQENAIRAAFSMQEVTARLTEARKLRNAPSFQIGIGIDCGEVLHGFIGNAERLEFSLVGDAANFAARYCNAARPGEILISPEVHARAWDLVVAEKATIKTKHEGDLIAHRLKKLRS